MDSGITFAQYEGKYPSIEEQIKLITPYYQLKNPEIKRKFNYLIRLDDGSVLTTGFLTTPSAVLRRADALIKKALKSQQLSFDSAVAQLSAVKQQAVLMASKSRPTGVDRRAQKAAFCQMHGISIPYVDKWGRVEVEKPKLTRDMAKYRRDRLLLKIEAKKLGVHL